jgi:hypothetical protein
MAPKPSRSAPFKLPALASSNTPAEAGPAHAGLLGAEVGYGDASAAIFVEFWGMGYFAEESEALIFLQLATAFPSPPVAKSMRQARCILAAPRSSYAGATGLLHAKWALPTRGDTFALLFVPHFATFVALAVGGAPVLARAFALVYFPGEAVPAGFLDGAPVFALAFAELAVPLESVVAAAELRAFCLFHALPFDVVPFLPFGALTL